MKGKKSTTGRTAIGDDNIVYQKITDPFKLMIRNALNAQHSVLTKRKQELEVWDENAKNNFKYAFGFANDKSRQWILAAVNKEINLNETIPLTNFIKVDEHVYANVNSFDLEHKINIGRKFRKSPLTGKDSQVVTLCHEMSHFDDILAARDLGGDHPRSFAEELIKNGSEQTMQSSYNFEMYFEKII